MVKKCAEPPKRGLAWRRFVRRRFLANRFAAGNLAFGDLAFGDQLFRYVLQSTHATMPFLFDTAAATSVVAIATGLSRYCGISLAGMALK